MLRFSRSKIIATVAIIVIGLLLAVPSMMNREQRQAYLNAIPSWVPSWLVPSRAIVLGLDLQGGISVTQRAVSGATCDDSSMKLAVEKIRDRVDALGVAEPEILCQGDTIVVNLPGVKNQRQAEDLVQVSGQVWLRPVMSQCQAVPKIDPSATTTSTTSPDGSTTTTGGNGCNTSIISLITGCGCSLAPARQRRVPTPRPMKGSYSLAS